MPTIRIEGLGLLGLMTDQPGYNIQPGGVTQGKNIRISDGRLRNFPGRVQYATPPIEPYGLFGFQTKSDETLWGEAGLQKVYVYDGTTHHNITRQAAAVDVDYTLNEYSDRWTGGAQGDFGFLCPGHGDAPQAWAGINQTTKLADMAYDPNAAPGSQTWKELNYAAFAMRPWKNTILAINLLRPGPGTELPNTVQWCHFIAPGATTTDWVPSATNVAGELVMADNIGPLIDGAPLRDEFIVYGTDSAWRMTFRESATSIFSARRLPGDVPQIINRNCIGNVREFHVIAATNDVYLFDGNKFRSILDNRYRETYGSVISSDRAAMAFVAVSTQNKEVWTCIPSSGAQFADRAIVWNYRDDTVSETDLPLVKDMDEGIIVPQVMDAFDDPPDVPFDQWFGPFDESPFTPTKAFMVGAHGTTLSSFSESQTDDGTPRECIMDRTKLVLDGSTQTVKRITAIRPWMDATGPVFIRAGGQYSPDSSLEWEPEQSIDPRSAYQLDFRAVGRLNAYRIRSNADIQWETSSIEIDYEVVRQR